MMGTMKLYIRKMIRKGGANLKFKFNKKLFKNGIRKDLIKLPPVSVYVIVGIFEGGHAARFFIFI